jgi:hypothetical protein
MLARELAERYQEQRGFMQLQIFREANDFIQPYGSSL